MQSCDEPPGYYSGNPSRRVLVWGQVSCSWSSCEVVWELPSAVSVPTFCHGLLCRCELLLCTHARSGVWVLQLLKCMERSLLIRCDGGGTQWKQSTKLEAVPQTVPSVINKDRPQL